MSRIEAANENYASTKAEIEGAAYAAGIYVQRLQELEAAGLNTAVAHREYEMIVEAAQWADSGFESCDR